MVYSTCLTDGSWSLVALNCKYDPNFLSGKNYNIGIVEFLNSLLITWGRLFKTMIIISLMFKLQFILLNILRLSWLLEPGREFESEYDDCDHHLRVRRHVCRRHNRGHDRDQSPSDVLVLQPPP